MRGMEGLTGCPTCLPSSIGGGVSLSELVALPLEGPQACLSSVHHCPSSSSSPRPTEGPFSSCSDPLTQQQGASTTGRWPPPSPASQRPL